MDSTGKHEYVYVYVWIKNKNNWEIMLNFRKMKSTRALGMAERLKIII